MTTTTTLDDLNATLRAHQLRHGVAERQSFGITYTTEYAVGRCGSQNGRRGTAGAKLHLLTVERAIAVPDGSRVKVGNAIAIRGCNGNGQFTGVVVDGADLAAVTCEKCRRRLDNAREIFAAANGGQS